MEANRSFVAKVSSQEDTRVRRNWAADPLLHYEATVRQVVTRGNIYKPRKKKNYNDKDIDGKDELELELDNVSGDE